MNIKGFPIAAAIALFATTVVCAAADMTVGTWTLHGSKSRYTPLAQARYETITIESVGDSMKITLEGKDSTGKRVRAEWTGKYDGKDYPVTGSPDIDSLAYTKTDDLHYKSTNKRAGKVMGTAEIVYSPDGKNRTVTSDGSNVKGEEIRATAVYDKR